MITVKYENYWNDYHRNSDILSFHSLTDLENWIFNQMEQDYSRENDWHVMCFPTPERVKKLNENGPWTIEFMPSKHSEKTCRIHMIRSEQGIIFSDVRLTAGHSHWSKDVQEWLTHCRERQLNPVFDFVN